MKDKHARRIKAMRSIRATSNSGVPTDSILATIYEFILECHEEKAIHVADNHEDGEA